MINIRDYRESDAPAITALMDLETRSGTALWTEVATPPGERRAWLAERAGSFAVLVAEADGFAGFATYGSFRPKDGYRLTVEHSVYVAETARGRGVARHLMTALIDAARDQGFHAMIGAVESGNAASLALHQSLGFAAVGQLPQVGAKFGRWLDLTLVQLLLDDAAAPSR